MKGQGSEAPVRGLSLARQAVIVGAALAVLGGGTAAFYWRAKPEPAAGNHDFEVSSQSKGPKSLFQPTNAQWATLTVTACQKHLFRSEQVTEGKIAIDEDRSTPVFSPYSGRVTKLLVKPGESVQRGQALFVVEAPDMVQAQNDFISATSAVNKARSQLKLAQIVAKRNEDLFNAKAVPLKDLQQAQADLINAQNDVQSSEISLEAARNRMRLFGRTDAEMKILEQKGTISPEIVISAPLSGTVVQRKIGPGQYVNAGASEPVFVIGDLSTVWLVAYVRETDAQKARVGQLITFSVLADPDRIYEAKVDYVAASLDGTTRRLLVRATVDNTDGTLKPEMFANVTLYSPETGGGVAIPRESVIYEADAARVWVARDDKSVELRRIKTGLVNGNLIQVIEGLAPGEKVVTRGSLFIDRIAAAGS